MTDDELRQKVERLESENKLLIARVVNMERRARERRWGLIEDTASRLVAALMLTNPKMTRAEMTRNAIERANVLVDSLDQYFDGNGFERD